MLVTEKRKPVELEVISDSWYRAFVTDDTYAPDHERIRFMESETTSPSSQVPTVRLHPNPVQSSSSSLNLFLKDPF